MNIVGIFAGGFQAFLFVVWQKQWNYTLCYKNNIRLLSECIKEYDSAFEDWRYWYEGNKDSKSLGWRDLHFFIEIIRDRVKSYIEEKLSGEE